MEKTLTLVERARRSCAIDAKIMASNIGVSEPTYSKYEENPGAMTIDQFFNMASHMDSFGKQIMKQYMEERMAAL